MKYKFLFSIAVALGFCLSGTLRAQSPLTARFTMPAESLKWRLPAASCASPYSAVLLKKWSADDLPLFCRIEHRMGQRLPMPVKFRLGSVEYVDWLEGKQDFPLYEGH